MGGVSALVFVKMLGFGVGAGVGADGVNFGWVHYWTWPQGDSVGGGVSGAAGKGGVAWRVIGRCRGAHKTKGKNGATLPSKVKTKQKWERCDFCANREKDGGGYNFFSSWFW